VHSKDDNSCYRNVCKMSVVSFALAVVFIIRLFSTSAFRVPKLHSIFDICSVATFPLPLHWMCDSPGTRCARRTTPIYTWHKQAIIKWSCHAYSFVACCHSVKLWALAARAFQSQQQKLSKNQDEILYSILFLRKDLLTILSFLRKILFQFFFVCHTEAMTALVQFRTRCLY